MSKQTQFKAGDAAFVKPRANGRGYTDANIKVPHPADARPIRCLPNNVWTRVRLTRGLMQIHAEGNLYIEAEIPADKADKPKAQQAAGGGDK